MPRNTNNPYHHGAHLYEANLRLPLISRIRRDEARVVGGLIARYADPNARALEVGPGTGFYTRELARAFREVVAVEDSAGMVEILREKLAAEGAANVAVHQGDFRELAVDGEFGVAAAIGVLDYIADPKGFVERMCAAARRAVIVTAPQRGLLGRCFAAGGAMRKTRVYCYDREQVSGWAPGWRCSIAEAGRATRLARPLTIVAAFERR
ncbi:MAG: class I SAM-dependent methyltransferase [Armatimonadota bacterium]